MIKEEWNLETKYNLVMRYEKGESIQDILTDANKIPGVHFDSEEILLKSLPHWKLLKHKEEVRIEAKFVIDQQKELEKKQKLIFDVTKACYGDEDEVTPEDKTKEELLKEIEDLRKKNKAYEDYIAWINDNKKLNQFDTYRYINEKIEWAKENKFNLKRWCKWLNSSWQGFKNWRDRPTPKGKVYINDQLFEIDLLNHINECLIKERHLIGIPYLMEMLADKKIYRDIKTVQRYMKEGLGHHCPGTRNFSTQLVEPMEIKFTKWGFDNLLLRYDRTKKKFVNDYKGNGINQRWFIDEKYVRVPWSKKWVYLCGIIDSWNDSIVALNWSDYRDSEIAHNTLDQAIEKIGKENVNGLILQSDHALIYFDREFSKKCEELGIKQSMGRVGISTDNRPIENFWKELELRHLSTFPLENRSKENLDTFVKDVVYNHNNRKQIQLGWMSPNEFVDL